MSDEKILLSITGDSWTSCLACGQRVTGDIKHTCLPKLRELTDEEIKQIFRDKTGYEVDTCPSAILDFSRAILKKANEK